MGNADGVAIRPVHQWYVQARLPGGVGTRPRLIRRVLIGSLVAAYTALLVIVAERVSLWGDEGFTAMMVRRPWLGMFADLSHIDVNMTVHYVLVKAVTVVAGDSPLTLRLVSIVSVLVAASLVPGIARRIGIPHPGVCACLLLLNPATVTMAATARPYALLLAGCAATLALLLRALRVGTTGSWLVWGMAGGVLFYVHMLGALAIGAQIVFLVVARRGVTLHPLRVAVALTVAAVLATPALVLSAGRSTLNWVGQATLRSVASATVGALGGPVAAVVVALLALRGLWAVMVYLRARRVLVRASALPLLPGVMVVSLAVALLAMLPIQSLFVNEYLTIALLPVTLLAAQGIACTRRPAVTAIAAVLLLAAGLGMQAFTRSLTFAKSDWSSLVRQLDHRVSPGEGVAFPNTFDRNVVEYYMLRQDAQRLEQTVPALPPDPWFSASAYQLDRDKRLGVFVDDSGLVHPLPRIHTMWLVGETGDVLDAAVETDLERSGYRVTTALSDTGVTAVEMQVSGTSGSR